MLPAGPASVPVRTYKRAKRQCWHEVGFDSTARHERSISPKKRALLDWLHRRGLGGRTIRPLPIPIQSHRSAASLAF